MIDFFPNTDKLHFKFDNTDKLFGSIKDNQTRPPYIKNPGTIFKTQPFGDNDQDIIKTNKIL